MLSQFSCPHLASFQKLANHLIRNFDCMNAVGIFRAFYFVRYSFTQMRPARAVLLAYVRHSQVLVCRIIKRLVTFACT